MFQKPNPWRFAFLVLLLVVGAVATAALVAWSSANRVSSDLAEAPKLKYEPRRPLDTSGFYFIVGNVRPWETTANSLEISKLWERIGYQCIEISDRELASRDVSPDRKVALIIAKATLFNSEGDTKQAAQLLDRARAFAEAKSGLAQAWLYSIIYFQGVTALRQGENDNCVLCRGQSSCILPIARSAIHTNPQGSRQAIERFTEYLQEFPDDLEVRWLLNLAHMTLGEYPDKVDAKYLVCIDHWLKSEFDIGKFVDIGPLVGVNRFNQAGGGIMEDFDNDGLLDLIVTSVDPTQPMGFFRNKGDGTFEDRTQAAGLSHQLSGLYCVQGDYNNDGHMDIFVARGAWLQYPMSPSLLRNNGDGTFTDVTKEAGLQEAVNSNSVAWADYDNDGFLDLFVCCERQPNRLYHNRGDGTFEEVAARAGVQGNNTMCKGCAWIDFDNDGYPDLFLNNLTGTAQLFHNNRDGSFTDVTQSMGIDGPLHGFSCWAFDYDNDGWLDIFATSYDRTLADVVRGLQGQPHNCSSNKLFRNLKGKGFRDVTREAGLDMVFATMGSNFADFDNDGYLDFYLGTGAPDFAMLVPNRMFRNIDGKRFAEITASSGTGHLQKGHSVACGDWDRDGNIDIFIEMGGVVNGDRYHNILFQNPGHGNHYLTVKLVGKKTNRAAIGARIKVVTAGDSPLTVHRHVSSGSSFGANPLQQTIGVGKATRLASLEITWPTSRTTQVFRDLAVDQAIEITELETKWRPLHWTKVPLPR